MRLSEAFAPLPALVGGAMIGAVCVARLRHRGKLSGLALDSTFVPGLALGGAFCSWRAPAAFEASAAGVSMARLVAAGACVGVGVPAGKGCTSGNGVERAARNIGTLCNGSCEPFAAATPFGAGRGVARSLTRLAGPRPGLPVGRGVC